MTVPIRQLRRVSMGVVLLTIVNSGRVFLYWDSFCSTNSLLKSFFKKMLSANMIL